VWSVPAQRVILDALVEPVLAAHRAEHPDADDISAPPVDLDAIAVEVQQIEGLLSAARSLSDAQLFAHLKSLDDLRQALDGAPDGEALRQRIAGLLDALFQSGVLDDV
jgi:hypothetical protein